MTETDAEFLDRLQPSWPGTNDSVRLPMADFTRLFALARRGADAAARIEQLEAENASLASWQCEFTDGKTGLVYGAGGSTYCAMAKEVERLRAALRKIADNKQVRGDCFCGACLQARHARAALEGK